MVVPDTCLCCGADYLGGHALPGKEMKEGLRVFYKCGSRLSIIKELSKPEEGLYILRFKNCNCDKCKNKKV